MKIFKSASISLLYGYDEKVEGGSFCIACMIAKVPVSRHVKFSAPCLPSLLLARVHVKTYASKQRNFKITLKMPSCRIQENSINL